MMVLFVILGTGAVFIIWTCERSHWPSAEMAARQQEVQRLQETLAALQAQLAAREEEAVATVKAPDGAGSSDALAMVDHTTSELLAQQVRDLQAENQRLRDDLGFYENLLPANGNGTIAIRSLQAERRTPTELSWQLLVMQPRRDAGTFKGRLEWEVRGQKDGEPWSLPTGKAQQALEFSRYQRIEGQLSVPADVQISSVTARVFEGRQERSSQTIELQP
ncbi:hypothetical protein D8I35_00410 [Corticibacter populi]|uniref:Uncharacterized protein n=2 Tax=Corticibacter populi TaxID=1550736 RepID=A0A3M6QXA7_9BURK|nr:hypothetical protein D8I35_00410 [Corticibacter populi]RZS30151.1 hypothetical protein EV687_3644 [Corticibacter populi]